MCHYGILKVVSDTVKGIGVLVCSGGNCIVELATLSGRGVAAVDWLDELRKRLHPYEDVNQLAIFDEADLRRAVKRIIREEMPKKPRFKSSEEAFNERFATTKGGSHSNVGTRIAEDFCEPIEHDQLNRRNFVESLRTNPLCALPPAAWVSRSEKLEHGKSRALFACDTINYMHFDAPCTAVERAWLGRRCILRPGVDSDCYEFSTLGKKLRKYKIMLDYEDFNSAHTLAAQKIVVEILFAGLDSAWHNWLVKSFDNMHVKDLAGEWQAVKGTLMSGHRMTSILNTILNASSG